MTDEQRKRVDPVELPQWAQDRAKELLSTAPQDMELWMVLAHGLAAERERCAKTAEYASNRWKAAPLGLVSSAVRAASVSCAGAIARAIRNHDL